MTGAVLAVLGNGGLAAGGSGGVTTPATLAWSDIYGEDSGSTQTLAVTGITTAIQLSAAKTGGGLLSYILNGAYSAYTGPFNVRPNDTLA